MELKNMFGFEAMNEQELLSVDGGARRVAAAPVSGASTKTAVGAQATVTGWGLAVVGLGLATGPVGWAAAGASLVVATIGLGNM